MNPAGTEKKDLTIYNGDPPRKIDGDRKGQRGWRVHVLSHLFGAINGMGPDSYFH
jgi:hypothetical protein